MNNNFININPVATYSNLYLNKYVIYNENLKKQGIYR